MQAVQLPKDLFATDIHWFPRSIGGKKQGQIDIFALAATDGNTDLISHQLCYNVSIRHP